jgi:hypothetical protein
LSTCDYQKDETVVLLLLSLLAAVVRHGCRLARQTFIPSSSSQCQSALCLRLYAAIALRRVQLGYSEQLVLLLWSGCIKVCTICRSALVRHGACGACLMQRCAMDCAVRYVECAQHASRIASQRIAAQRIAAHRFASQRIASHRIRRLSAPTDWAQVYCMYVVVCVRARARPRM